MYDGKNPPKMLEYNADTPSMIIESSVLQDGWFKDVIGESGNHQSNYIEEMLKIFANRVSKTCKNPTLLMVT